MRKSGFFPRLALVNLMRNGRFYGPYLLSCGMTAAMYYILSYLTFSDIVASVRGAGYLQSLMYLGRLVVTLFSAVLLLYANSFVMKRRRRELGLYNILGLEKRHTARLMVWETLYCAAAAIVGGLAAGVLLSKLVLLLLLQLSHLPVEYGFEISLSGMADTAALFGFLFLLTLVWNLFGLLRSRPVELLHSASAGEREPRTRRLLVVLGAVTLGAGYATALTVEDPFTALAYFFLAVALVMVGTYCLFTAGSIALLKHLRNSPRYYYQPKHFTAVAGLLYRMKQNAVGLANICILSTMVLVILSSTCSLWFGAEDMIHTRYPADVLVSMEDPNHMIDMDTFLTDELKSVPGGSYTSYEFLTGYDSTEETEDHSSAIFMKDGAAQVDSITRNVLFFSAETYNRITGENVTVEPGTALYMSVDGVPMPDTMTFAGTTYTLLPTPKSFNLRGRYHAYVSKPYVVVLPDYAEKSQVITPTEYYCISLGKLRDEEQQTFYDAIREDVTTIMPDEESVFWDEDGYFNFECRVENTKEIRSMYGSFLFMGISLGFVFTMAAVLIIYYKQISEGMEDKNRFAIMQQVGLSQKEVKHAIHTQILTVFFLPLITAGIHVMFAYPIIRAILRAMMLSSETVFITCTVASFLVFSVLYAVVYALTAKVYYRIISEDNK